MALSVLTRPTLVLNRNWQPINVATVARALVMLWNDTVQVVDPDDYQLYTWDDWAQLVPSDDEYYVQSPTRRFRVPEVVTLRGFDRVPEARVTFSRRNVFKRDRYMCQYCGIQPGTEELTIDHVIPRSAGGQSDWMNCVLACTPLQFPQSESDSGTSGDAVRKVPERPSWRPFYADHRMRIESWSRFMSAAYWNAELLE